MKKDYGKIFHTALSENTYQLSSSLDGYEVCAGKASRNSYLIVGDTEAILFDLSLAEPDLILYAEKLSAKPVRIVLSHAHVDHIFNAEKTNELWLHAGDEKLLKKGALFQRAVKPCPNLHFLNDGETIDIGNRTLNVIHISGHTDGSILLYDEKTKFLFSGDTIARRLLYGLHTYVPVSKFCDRIAELNKLEIAGIYSVHDRICLPKEHINYMIDMLTNRIPKEAKVKNLLVLKLLTFSDGKETDIRYFDFAGLKK